MKKAHLLWFSLLCLLFACTSSKNANIKKMTIKGKAFKGTQGNLPVASGNVALIAPGPRKWQRLKFASGSNVPNTVVTDADGSYSFTVEFTWFEELKDQPIYVAVSDEAKTFTLISLVPQDMAKEDAEVPLNTTPQTTVAGLWQCGHGVFPKPDYGCPNGVTCSYAGGAPCYQDPEPSKTTADFVDAIDGANIIGATPDVTDPGGLSETLLGNAALLKLLNDRLKALGYPEVTDITVLTKQIKAGALPKIPLPTPVDANDGTEASDSQGFGCAETATCSGYSPCDKCSFRACACGDGSAYYQTSGGSIYACAAAGNCQSAATAVINRCCTTSRNDEFEFEKALRLIGVLVD